jgi:hypothetical protein
MSEMKLIMENWRKLNENVELQNQLDSSPHVQALRDELRKRKDLGRFVGSGVEIMQDQANPKLKYIAVKFGFITD